MRLILVGLDASPRAPEVLAAALDLADKTGAKLLLARAVALPVELPVVAYAFPPDDLAGVLREQAREGLEQLARAVPPERLEGIVVEVGTPWNVICDLARARNADLIAVGSHGYGGLDRLLGTTAAKVLNHADRSVLVVRAPSLFAGASGKSK
jgi:nucleotide-binding universal stress UspA family protein